MALRTTNIALARIGGHSYGSSSFGDQGRENVVDGSGRGTRMSAIDNAYGRGQQDIYGRHAKSATTVTQMDHEKEMSRQEHAQPPYSDAPGSTNRRTGFLYKFPTRRYPNPKRHRPIMTHHQPNLMHTTAVPGKLTARKYMPLEMKGKRFIEKINYLRPTPVSSRVTKEMYFRLKYGLFDLDRTMPELWGPQEGFKLDRDEWLFKLLYFLHPIVEEDLCIKAEVFPHSPFDSDKELVMSLERLVSREYVRRVKGKDIPHPDVSPDAYYWTLMPDELSFGEKVVVEERYMQTMKEGGRLHSPLFPIREEMLAKNYQEKHNTFAYFDEIRDVAKLEAFVGFCREERKETVKKLAAINQTLEFPDVTEEEFAAKERKRKYPDPPTLLSPRMAKINWHNVGHWRTSIPDGKMPMRATGI
eukprot:TRINITY_DN23655_c0_g1_i1.p1 TRINITY_DN23655_c0_g1~~TRINITY_DN23655_c0_g1_i1.p1  ORF type:complete len:415 (+),score=131.40 TRINITY_DN23655_c0_g1_i1:66-1310(+)